MFKKITIVSLLIIFSTQVFSDSLVIRQFALHVNPTIEAENCALVERRTINKSIPLKIPGLLKKQSCQVSLSKPAYKNLFQFCYQSGINLYQPAELGSFECFIQERDNDYLFMADLYGATNHNTQLICYYSCITQ